MSAPYENGESSSNALSNVQAIPPAQEAASKESAWKIAIPSNFLILPPAAATLGLVIGMTRGGRIARLRFLAENVHRQPTTYQGWYFYTKTRNYKMFYQACLSGGKYAIALAGATSAYVFLEEYTAYLREEALGRYVDRAEAEGLRRKTTWRRGGAVWWDGAIAGTVLGTAVGLMWRLPRGLVFRCISFGAVLGGTESALQVARDKIGVQLKEEENRRLAEEALQGGQQGVEQVKPVEHMSAPPPIAAETPRYALVDRDLQPGFSRHTAIDELISGDAPEEEKKAGWWSKATSWIPGR